MEIKYKVGDKVWYGTTHGTTKSLPCPDCLDSKKWKAVAPAGNEYEFDCPRCTRIYHGKHELSLDYAVYVPHVRQLTIGSIRTDSDAKIDEQVSYMCMETGVGSGSIYYQPMLHDTEESARIHAELRCQIQQCEAPHVVATMKQALSIADYQLSNADMVEASRVRYELRYALQDFANRIRDCNTIEEVRQQVEELDAQP